MAFERWTTIAVTAAVLGLGAGCAQQAPVTPAQGEAAAPGERQLLSVGGLPSLAEIEAQLPERIPEAEAERLLVRIDASQIQAPGASFGVLQADDDEEQEDEATAAEQPQTTHVGVVGRDGRQIVRGSAFDATRDFTRSTFYPRSSAFMYYGLGSSYYPYYYNQGSYYPYRNVYRSYWGSRYGFSPFIRRYGSYYMPFSYNWPITYNAGGSVGLVGYGAD